MTAQSFRTKAFYEGLAEKLDRQAFGRTFSQLWESMFITANHIARRHWALMMIETNEVFYLGDNPVVLQRTDSPKDGSNLGFDVEGVEVFLPLSPKCALYMPSRSTSEDRMARYRAAIDLHRTVRSHVLRGLPGGKNELQTAELVISRLHPLVQAFTKGTPITADAANIENLNYLQCSWAQRAIYSNRRDFAFARHVFERTPAYRAVPKTSLVQMNLLVPKPRARHLGSGDGFRQNRAH
jgi:hypothetical protein